MILKNIVINDVQISRKQFNSNLKTSDCRSIVTSFRSIEVYATKFDAKTKAETSFLSPALTRRCTRFLTGGIIDIRYAVRLRAIIRVPRRVWKWFHNVSRSPSRRDWNLFSPMLLVVFGFGKQTRSRALASLRDHLRDFGWRALLTKPEKAILHREFNCEVNFPVGRETECRGRERGCARHRNYSFAIATLSVRRFHSLDHYYVPFNSRNVGRWGLMCSLMRSLFDYARFCRTVPILRVAKIEPYPRAFFAKSRPRKHSRSRYNGTALQLQFG